MKGERHLLQLVSAQLLAIIIDSLPTTRAISRGYVGQKCTNTQDMRITINQRAGATCNINNQLVPDDSVHKGPYLGGDGRDNDGAWRDLISGSQDGITGTTERKGNGG